MSEAKKNENRTLDELESMRKKESAERIQELIDGEITPEDREREAIHQFRAQVRKTTDISDVAEPPMFNNISQVQEKFKIGDEIYVLSKEGTKKEARVLGYERRENGETAIKVLTPLKDGKSEIELVSMNSIAPLTKKEDRENRELGDYFNQLGKSITTHEGEENQEAA